LDEDGMEIIGPVHEKPCNQQPCVTCDMSKVPVVAGSAQTQLTSFSLKTTDMAAFFSFSGANVDKLDIYVGTNIPQYDQLQWTYTVTFTQDTGTFTVKIPLSFEFPGGSPCNETVYFVVKTKMSTGAVGYGQGMYSLGSFGSAIGCVNYCEAEDNGTSSADAYVQFDGENGGSEFDKLVAGNNVVGPSNGSSNPATTLKILYIVLPISAFIIAVAISAILLRKKFSQIKTAESEDEAENDGQKTQKNAEEGSMRDSSKQGGETSEKQQDQQTGEATENRE